MIETLFMTAKALIFLAITLVLGTLALIYFSLYFTMFLLVELLKETYSHMKPLVKNIALRVNLKISSSYATKFYQRE